MSELLRLTGKQSRLALALWWRDCGKMGGRIEARRCARELSSEDFGNPHHGTGQTDGEFPAGVAGRVLTALQVCEYPQDVEYVVVVHPSGCLTSGAI